MNCQDRVFPSRNRASTYLPNPGRADLQSAVWNRRFGIYTAGFSTASAIIAFENCFRKFSIHIPNWRFQTADCRSALPGFGFYAGFCRSDSGGEGDSRLDRRDFNSRYTRMPIAKADNKRTKTFPASIHTPCHARWQHSSMLRSRTNCLVSKRENWSVEESDHR